MEVRASRLAHSHRPWPSSLAEAFLTVPGLHVLAFLTVSYFHAQEHVSYEELLARFDQRKEVAVPRRPFVFDDFGCAGPESDDSEEI